MTGKGQVTIPVKVREQMGIYPGSKLNFVIKGDALLIERVAIKAATSLSQIMRGKGSVKMSTDEILALTRMV
ncbi:MAG TPA: AbrB/MazE/SpoVT family DNA-binding domain-containing protein [Fimbriimonadaceae bacterium]